MSKIITKTILLAVVIAAMLPTIMQADTNPEPVVPAKVAYQLLANQISAQYAVPAANVKKIIKCESNWSVEAHQVSSRESSYGLVQINLKAHKDITIDQAKDPGFAITYLAKNMAKGNAPQMWYTCSK